MEKMDIKILLKNQTAKKPTIKSDEMINIDI
jgi:hypothetical protein